MNSTEPRKTIIDYLSQYSIGSHKLSETLSDESRAAVDEEVANLFHSNWSRVFGSFITRAEEELKEEN